VLANARAARTGANASDALRDRRELADAVNAMAVRINLPSVSDLTILQPKAAEVPGDMQLLAARMRADAQAVARVASQPELAFLAPYVANKSADESGEHARSVEPSAQPADRADRSEHEVMSEFFAGSTAPDRDQVGHDEDDFVTPDWLRMRTSDRLAMWATFGMLGVFFTAIFALVVYRNTVMPEAVELNDGFAPVQVTQLQPPSAAKADTFEGLVAHARDCARRGFDQQALDTYERALSLRPGEPAALAGKAFAHLNLDDRFAAKQFATQAVTADPTNSQAWVVLGAAEELLGSRKASQDAFRRCATQGVGGYVTDCQKLVR
jgi:hypothetical protein